MCASKNKLNRILAAAALLSLTLSAAVTAQERASVAFPQVTGMPVPLQSISGRFSSLNPLGRHNCADRKVSGQVVSARLILVKEMDCGRSGHDNALVNVRFANPADAAQMTTGRHIVITGKFTRAEEDREPTIVAEFLVADNAAIVSADPLDHPVPAFTSYMICQPPELDALAAKLKSEMCVQSTIVANLAEEGPALETAARAPSNAAPDAIVAGEAGEISCRTDPGVSDHHLTAIACAKNSYWAWYKALHDPQFSMPAPA